MTLPFLSLPSLFQNACLHTSGFHWHYRKNGEWLSYSEKELYQRLSTLYFFFKKIGIKKNDHVGLLLKNSPDWILCDLAIQICQAITVPLFPNLAEENFLYEIQDTNMNTLILESKDFLDTDLHKHLSSLKCILQLEKTENKTDNTLFLEDYLNELEKESKTNEAKEEFEKAISLITENSLFSIIYTSGSTGYPKGVELTHKNMLSQFLSLKKLISLSPQNSALSILPLAHIFERMTIYFLVFSGMNIYFGDDPKNLTVLLKESKPNLITVVPRILERIFEKIQKLANTSKFPKKLFLKPAIRFAQTHDPLQNKGIQGIIFDKLVYKNIRNLFGGKLSYVISGSSALNKNVCRFFLNVGVPIFEGYGMTECSPVITINAEEKSKPGSVGTPLEHLDLKISDKGEILVRGESVFKGYHNLKEKNAEYFSEDGFFHTGDSGYFGKNGQLYLTGRIKEMMKTSTGKYVSPTPIEEDLLRLPLISSACVVANNKKFVSALIFLSKEACQEYLQIPIEIFSAEKALLSKRINSAIEKHIQKTNRHLNHWEQIRRFKLLPDTLSAETGLLTPTLKIRRREIEKMFEKEIEELYNAES